MLGELEGEEVRPAVGLTHRQALVVEVDEGLRVAHDERAQLQSEEPAVLERQVVHGRDPHRPRLGIEAGRKIAQRVDPAPHPALCLQDEGVVTLAQQLESRHQPRDAAADDDDPLGDLGDRLQPLGRGLQDGGRHRIGDQPRFLGGDLVSFPCRSFRLLHRTHLLMSSLGDSLGRRAG